MNKFKDTRIYGNLIVDSNIKIGDKEVVTMDAFGNTILPGTLKVTSEVDSTSVHDPYLEESVTTGAVIVTGGVGIEKQLRVNGETTIDGLLSVNDLTAKGPASLTSSTNYISTSATTASVLNIGNSAHTQTTKVFINGGTTGNATGLAIRAGTSTHETAWIRADGMARFTSLNIGEAGIAGTEGTEVIDSSRNIAGTNATFSGTINGLKLSYENNEVQLGVPSTTNGYLGNNEIATKTLSSGVLFKPFSIGQKGETQLWTVPQTLTYRITAAGAQGGYGAGAKYYGVEGGKGAELSADFSLTAGTIIEILVGQIPVVPAAAYFTSGDYHGGGGGGATFVLKRISSITNSNYQFSWNGFNYEILMVVAGGGGTGDASYSTSYRSSGGSPGKASVLGTSLFTPSSYASYTTTTFIPTASASSIGGSISQLIGYNGYGGYYNRGSQSGWGGYGCGGIQDDNRSGGGGWTTAIDGSTSFTTGTNYQGFDGVNIGGGYCQIASSTQVLQKTYPTYRGYLFDELGNQINNPSISTTNLVITNNMNHLKGSDLYNNTFIGVGAGQNSISSLVSGYTYGTNNTFIGTDTGFSNYQGSRNTAIGSGSQKGSTTASGTDNTSLGYNSLYSLTYGSFNMAIGKEALALNTTGSGNVAIGSSALGINTTGDSNVAIGTNALADTDANYNTAVGDNALHNNTSGYNNTAVGRYAMYLATTSSNNTALGVEALRGLTSSSNYNIGIGINAGRYIKTAGSTTEVTTNKTNNIYIGYNARVGCTSASTTVTNEIVIGYEAAGSGSNTVTIGNSSITQNYFSGTVNSTYFNITSDKRLKKDIENIDNNLSNKLLDLKVKTYYYKNEDKPQDKQIGLIAQEVQETLGDNYKFLVDDSNKDCLTIRESKLIYFLLDLVQKQEERIKKLEKKV